MMRPLAAAGIASGPFASWLLFASSPDGIIGNLINLGGMGMLSAALFYLHVQALKAHREDLAAERLATATLGDRIMAKLEDHQEETRQRFGAVDDALIEFRRRRKTDPQTD